MENYKFSTLEYKRPDLETRRAKLAQWKAAVGQAESYSALRSLILTVPMRKKLGEDYPQILLWMAQGICAQIFG